VPCLDGAAVRVGVNMRGGRLHAHAWVEYGGDVLGDDDTTDYERLGDFDVNDD